jgi:putative RNA 2'-phosphotransferase
MSLVLRHRPHDVGLALDAHGWVAIDALCAALAAEGVTRAEIDEVVRTSDKQRFAISDDGARIRAQQGHSIAVELAYAPAVPPPRLYHGTVARFVPSIRAQGLVRGARHHVHLSATIATARAVGARRGAPVVLAVRAAALAEAGHAFARTPNGVWLVDHVPPEFLEPGEVAE